MRKSGLVAASVAGLYILQYLAISHIGVGIYNYIGSTYPYAIDNSYLPLPRGFVLAVYPVLRVLTQPLSLIVSWIGSTRPYHWSRYVMVKGMMLFGSETDRAVKNNHFVFAMVNTFLWCLAAALCVLAYRGYRRYHPVVGQPPGEHERA